MPGDSPSRCSRNEQTPVAEAPALWPAHAGSGVSIGAEHARPLGEREVGRHDDRRALVEATDEVEQQLATRLRERQVAEFVEHQQVDAGDPVSNASTAAKLHLCFELVDQIDGVEEGGLPPGADDASGDAEGDVALAGTRAADQHDVPLLVEEGAGRELLDRFTVDRRACEVEVGKLLGERQLGNAHLVVVDRACLAAISVLSSAPMIFSTPCWRLTPTETTRRRLPACRRAAAGPSCRGYQSAPWHTSMDSARNVS